MPWVWLPRTKHESGGMRSPTESPSRPAGTPRRKALTNPLEAGSAPHVVILGSDARALAVREGLESKGAWIVGHLSADGGGPEDLVVGSYADLSAVLREEVVDRVVVAIPHEGARRVIEDALRVAERMGVPLFSQEAIAGFLGRGRLEGGEKLVPIGAVRLPSGFQVFMKLFLDRLMALIMVIFGSPLFPVLALLIKLDSKGPVIFRQVRVRNNGRHFHLFKFRTMVANAEDLKARLMTQNQADGPAFKIAGDPRITRVGAVLRHFRMDELLQLFNILRGEMSFVGPRPPLPNEVDRYEDWYLRRLSVTPGLTCLWQLEHGPLGIGFTDWMRLDLRYVDNWSLRLDLQILLRTIPLVLFGVRAM